MKQRNQPGAVHESLSQIAGLGYSINKDVVRPHFSPARYPSETNSVDRRGSRSLVAAKDSLWRS